MTGESDIEQYYGPGWRREIHNRTVHSMIAVTIAGMTATIGPIEGLVLAIPIGLFAFWWLPGAREICHDWQSDQPHAVNSGGDA